MGADPGNLQQKLDRAGRLVPSLSQLATNGSHPLLSDPDSAPMGAVTLAPQADDFGQQPAPSMKSGDHDCTIVLGDEASLAGVDAPIFMAHGRMDPMIPIIRAVTSREALTALGYSVEWHEYPMGHQVCPEEIADIGAWLRQRFA